VGGPGRGPRLRARPRDDQPADGGARRLRGDRRPARRARGGQRLDLPRELL
jgi:hypothetical protein